MIRKLLGLFTVAVLAAACSDAGLGLAQLVNVEDTVVLGSLTGSSLALPSGFSVPEAITVNTDKSTASGFDFVYQILPDNRHVFMPLAAIGLGIVSGTNPAMQKVSSLFEAVKTAPTSGYSTTDSLTIAVGDVIVVKSRVTCYLGVPQYAKFHILSFDDVAHSVRMAVLGDINCGYRSLEPGVPLE